MSRASPWYDLGMPKKKQARRSAKSNKATKRASPKRRGAMFQKIAFTLFPVQDAKRARAFYERVLGFQRGLASPDGAWTEYDLPGGGCLALFRHPDPPLPVHPAERASPSRSPISTRSTSS